MWGPPLRHAGPAWKFSTRGFKRHYEIPLLSKPDENEGCELRDWIFFFVYVQLTDKWANRGGRSLGNSTAASQTSPIPQWVVLASSTAEISAPSPEWKMSGIEILVIDPRIAIPRWWVVTTSALVAHCSPPVSPLLIHLA